MFRLRIKTIFLAAAAMAVCLAVRPARGDDFADLLKEIDERVGLPFGANLADTARWDTTQASSYVFTAEELYNDHHRALALRFIDAGISHSRDPSSLRDMRLKIAQLELDLPTFTKLLRAGLDEAIRSNACPSDRILADPILQSQLLPEYAAAFRRDPGNDALCQFLMAATRDPSAALEICKLRLAARPDDAKAADKFPELCMRSGNHALLADEAKLPAAVVAGGSFPAFQAQAFILLHQPVEARVALEKGERLAGFAENWQWFSGLYAMLGDQPRARAIAAANCPAASAALGVVLAQNRDADGLNACGRAALQSNGNALELLTLADLVREGGDPALGEALSMQGYWCVSSGSTAVLTEVSAYCLDHGRIVEFAERQLVPSINDAALLEILRFVNWAQDQSSILPMLERHAAEFKGRFSFESAYALQLKEAGRVREALAENRASLASLKNMSASPSGTMEECQRSVQVEIYRCMMLLKEYDACEAMLRENPVMPLVNFYEESGQIDKAIAAQTATGNYSYGFIMTSRHKGAAAAVAYVAALPAVNQAEFGEAVLELKQDRQGLADCAGLRAAMNPGNPDARAAWALRLMDNHQPEAARAQIRAAIDVGCQFNTIPPLQTSPSCMGWERDETDLQQVIEAYDRSGSLALLEGDLAPLLAQSNRARVGYLIRLADHQEQAGRITQAIEALQKAAELDPFTDYYARHIAELRKRQLV